jgi:hypothetical protein
MSAKRRKKLPASKFGLPGKKKFPLDTKGRAANAKARATQGVKAGTLSPSEAAQVKARANKVLGKTITKKRKRRKSK